jgi:hypothetical protein
MLIGYGVSDAMIVAGAMGAYPLAAAGIAGHGLVGPIVHAANGEGWKALGSAAMTLGPPAIAFAAFLGPSCSGEMCGFRGIPALFISAGTVFAANVVDVGALAYKKRGASTETARLRIAPIVSPTVTGAALSGAF